MPPRSETRFWTWSSLSDHWNFNISMAEMVILPWSFNGSALNFRINSSSADWPNWSLLTAVQKCLNCKTWNCPQQAGQRSVFIRFILSEHGSHRNTIKIQLMAIDILGPLVYLDLCLKISGDDHLTGPLLDALHRNVLRRVARPHQQQSLPENSFVSRKSWACRSLPGNLSIPRESGMCGTEKWPEIHYIL